MPQVIKSIWLNVLPLSNHKHRVLCKLFDAFRDSCNFILDLCKREKPWSFAMLHSRSYHLVKKKFALHSQIVIDAIHHVWESLCNNPAEFTHPPVRFNIPRSGKFSHTKRGNLVAVIAVLGGRLAIPVKQDGAYRRFKSFLNIGYKCTQFRIIRKKERWFIIASLRKEFTIKKADVAIGIDVNSGSFAVTVYNNRVIKQFYFGQDIWHRQWKFMKYRKMLQSFAAKGDKRARRALRRLRGKERNFVKTRILQVAHETIDLAKRYNAFIAVERLEHIRRRRNRIANRKIYRIPYAKFLTALQSVAWQNGVFVKSINGAYTSQTCPNCEHRSKRNWIFFNGKRRLFRCIRCGYEANPDRIASLNIARKALLLERTLVQDSKSGDAVSQPIWHDEEVSQRRFTPPSAKLSASAES
jgi:IS605 OrfB family transposase